SDVYAALFDPETDDLKEEVRAGFDVFHSDILVLGHVLLSPRWRGLKLGLLAARKMSDLVGGGCGLAGSLIHWLNPDAGEVKKVTRISVESLRPVAVLYEGDIHELACLLLKLCDANDREAFFKTGSPVRSRPTVNGLATYYSMVSSVDAEQVRQILVRHGLPL